MWRCSPQPPKPGSDGTGSRSLLIPLPRPSQLSQCAPIPLSLLGLKASAIILASCSGFLKLHNNLKERFLHQCFLSPSPASPHQAPLPFDFHGSWSQCQHVIRETMSTPPPIPTTFYMKATYFQCIFSMHRVLSGLFAYLLAYIIFQA